MALKLVLGHQTKRGPVFIAKSDGGRYHVVWKGEKLGSYSTKYKAVDDVAGGHTFSPSDGTDLGALGLSGFVCDWVDPKELE